jgi:LPXTG-motif cell wall-anchored protein
VNVSKSPLRRAAALAAGSLIGIAGAVAFASPALAHHSNVSGTSECINGEWVVDWKATAIGDGKQGREFKWVKVEFSSTTNKVDNEDLSVNGKWHPSDIPLTGKQRVPGAEKSATLSVEAVWNNEAKDSQPGTYTVNFSGVCEKPSEPETPTEPETPVEIPKDVKAKPFFEMDCDTIEIGVDNTMGNETPFTVEYETSKGEKRTLVVKPGERKGEKFSATEGFSVDVTFSVEFKGKTYTTSGNVPWEQPAEGCDDGEGGGDLPLTGAAAGGVAAGAAGLLAVGAAMFFVARRRKVKFTA